MGTAFAVVRWLIEVALLVALLIWCVRALRDRTLLLLTLASFGLRLGIGEALYVASVLRLPVLRSLQVPGGFWAFGLDAIGYDAGAKSVMASVTHGHVPHAPAQSFDWIAGAIYTVFGPNPSQVLAFNADCTAAYLPLAYLIARQTGFTKALRFRAHPVPHRLPTRDGLDEYAEDLEEFKERADLPEQGRRAILWDNPRRFYGLPSGAMALPAAAAGVATI